MHYVPHHIRVLNKVSGHHSEVSYGANVGAQRAKGDRKRYAKAARAAAKALCKAWR